LGEATLSFGNRMRLLGGLLDPDGAEVRIDQGHERAVRPVGAGNATLPGGISSAPRRRIAHRDARARTELNPVELARQTPVDERRVTTTVSRILTGCASTVTPP
jgi:hypothetical protein